MGFVLIVYHLMVTPASNFTFYGLGVELTPNFILSVGVVKPCTVICRDKIGGCLDATRFIYDQQLIILFWKSPNLGPSI